MVGRKRNELANLLSLCLLNVTLVTAHAETVIILKCFCSVTKAEGNKRRMGWVMGVTYAVLKLPLKKSIF